MAWSLYAWPADQNNHIDPKRPLSNCALLGVVDLPVSRAILFARTPSSRKIGNLFDLKIRAIEELSGPTRADVAEVQETLRVAIRRWFRREVGKRPTVLPVVLEL